MITSHTSQRYIVFDAVRGLAVALAMVDHVKIQFVPDVHVLVPLTRLSTPSFIILFGVMIELAYLSKLRAGATVTQTRKRLRTRMLQCMAIFAGLTIAAMVSGNLSLAEGVRALSGIGPGRFSEILMIYTLLFAIVLVLLPILMRYGAYAILGLAAFGWCLKTLVESTFAGPTPYIVTFFTGIGEGYGPALLPALTFLGFGLALGEAMTTRGNKVLPVILFILAALFCTLELSNGLMETGRRFLAHRWTNHPAYFAVGIMGFAGFSLLLLAALRVPSLSLLPEGLARAGKRSLFIYGGGNLALNLLPTFDMSRLEGACMAILFLAGLFGIALFTDKASKAQRSAWSQAVGTWRGGRKSRIQCLADDCDRSRLLKVSSE